MKNRKAFVGATIINGDKNVPILENGTVLVGPDGNIEAVGTDIKLNPSVEIVNVSGKYNIKRPEQVVAMGKHYPNPHFKEYPGIE